MQRKRNKLNVKKKKHQEVTPKKVTEQNTITNLLNINSLKTNKQKQNKKDTMSFRAKRLIEKMLICNNKT